MAYRRYQGNLVKKVTMQLLQQGPVDVADPYKVDSELMTIFNSIYLGDPTQSGANGNLSGSHVPVVTPATANQEFAVAHNLKSLPKGVFQVVPMLPGSGYVRLRFSRAPDITYAYFKCPDAEDEGVLTTLFFLGAS